MDKVLRIGSVGTSKIMGVMQEAIRMTEGVETTVIYSRDPERGKAFAEKVGVKSWCSDYQEFVNREDVDIVYIASPNVCHKEQAIAAMEAGKHVIVEKPASTTVANIREMGEAARKNNVFFFEAISTIFMPNFLALKELLPQLGRVGSAKVTYGRYSSQYDNYLSGKNPNIFNPAMEGGALNDMGIYCIHTMLDLFGKPESISCEAEYAENGIDMMDVVRAKYPDLTCTLQTAKDRNLECGTWLYCENGWFTQEGELHNFENCKTEIMGLGLEVNQQGDENRLIYELARFRDAIRTEDKMFFERMYHQSENAAWVLEKAHNKGKK